MKLFTTHTINDGLYSVLPTILVHVAGDMMTIGVWWMHIAVHIEWVRWNRKKEKGV